ncbi:MAG: hypothetical protein ISS70_20000 [Phycisphaerae bacterium]|nr:hypothetical protein [Phycisphaerae bacterium]
MNDPRTRDDLSKFVVHLTRRHDGQSARANLLSILDAKLIKARNAHCLFKHDIARLNFTEVLQRSFKTVCFTETPLTQIARLTAEIPGRQIQLEPYGIVFYKDTVLERGGNPAIYINGNSHLRDYLLKQFRQHFSGIRSLLRFKQRERMYHESIIQYYSLVNVISSNHDFTWEREWRFNGNFKFSYIDIVAVIARNPEQFQRLCEERFSGLKLDYIRGLSVISPDWTYEDIVETMSVQIWNNANS